jgi:hypothetical protein
MRVDDRALARDLWVAWRGAGGDVEGVRAPGSVATDVLSFYDVFAGPSELAAWDAWRVERARSAQGQAA